MHWCQCVYLVNILQPVQYHICDWILENWPNCHTRPSYSILLAQLIATLIHYPLTVPLLDFTDWSAFLEPVLLPCKFMIETMVPWKTLHGRNDTPLRSSEHVCMHGLMADTSWTHATVVQKVLTACIVPSDCSSFPTTHSTHSYMHHSWYYSGYEMVTQNPAVPAS